MIMQLVPTAIIVFFSVVGLLLCWRDARRRGLHQTAAARLGLAMGTGGLVLGLFLSLMGVMQGGAL